MTNPKMKIQITNKFYDRDTNVLLNPELTLLLFFHS